MLSGKRWRAMREPRPFLEAGSQFGVSRTAFRRMRKAEKLELMIGWFHLNFEDPAQSTPYESAEGGYQWIWGGPYEARDELYSKFGDIVSESFIEEAVKEIESDGIVDWAPVHTGDDYDEPEPPEDPISLDIRSEREPKPRGRSWTSAGPIRCRLRSKFAADLYGAFPVKRLFWVVLTVFCSERERPFFVPSPAIRSPERAEGVKGPKR